MTTLVHNDSGRLFNKVSPIGKIFIVTAELAVYLEKGFIFTRELGKEGITVISRDELEREFTEIDGD